MDKIFLHRVPQKPLLKRETYQIPGSYDEAYEKVGVSGHDEKIMLFHTTQFGGFRLKRFPRNMQIKEEFLERWFNKKHERGQLHFRASQDFLSAFGGMSIEPLRRIWNINSVNEEEMLENGFSEEDVTDSINFLSELNKFYSFLELGISLPQSGITAEDRVQMSRFHGIPYLVKKPRAGGRFFHPEVSYQRISPTFRRTMTINGEQTSEIDISAATLQFLNIALEDHTSASIRDSVLEREDPYDYFLSILNSENVGRQYQEQQMARDAVKELVYTAIYSQNGSQEKNVDRKLRLMNRNYRCKDLVDFFPEFFEGVSELHSNVPLPLYAVIFREESRYAQRVLERGCLEERIPILPIHDSFITGESNLRDLMDIMDAVSEEMYGRRLKHKQKY
ncbi:MAG: hypothetical protein Q8P81_03040 [Nanoarchaeota archaeon]|nr:hypothetical protein [Nanoarchaeota archaeon]